MLTCVLILALPTLTGQLTFDLPIPLKETTLAGSANAAEPVRAVVLHGLSTPTQAAMWATEQVDVANKLTFVSRAETTRVTGPQTTHKG